MNKIEAFSFPIYIADIKNPNIILIKIENNNAFFKWDNDTNWSNFNDQKHSTYNELIEFYSKNNIKKIFDLNE